MNLTLTIISLGVACGAIGVALYAWKKMRSLALAVAHLMLAVKNLADVATEQQKVNDMVQQGMQHVDSNLEILGVHTKLIPPTVSYEASAFLAWYNKKKEEKDNG